MTGRTPWARVRERRAESPGRHRKLPVITETPMQPSLAASLPQPDLRAPVPAPQPEPGPPFAFTVLGGDLGQAFGAAYAKCGTDTASALDGGHREQAAWQLRENARRSSYHRADGFVVPAPVPASAPPAAEALDPLPVAEPEPGPVDMTATWTPPQYALDAVDKTDAERAAAQQQQEAADRLAAWSGGKTLTEDEEPAEAPAEPDEGGPALTDACRRGDHEKCNDPAECACGHHEQDAAEAARDLAVFLGPEEKGFGPEDPGPAPVADEDATPDSPAADHAEEGDA